MSFFKRKRVYPQVTKKDLTLGELDGFVEFFKETGLNQKYETAFYGEELDPVKASQIVDAGLNAYYYARIPDTVYHFDKAISDYTNDRYLRTSFEQAVLGYFVVNNLVFDVDVLNYFLADLI